MRPSTAIRAAGVAAVALALTACAAGPNDAAGRGTAELAGFWPGLWHGLISPVTFVISLFTDSVGLYEVHNNGNWYDLGFMIGIMLVFSGTGGSGAAAQRRRRRG
ncbi:MAG TPA: hypothetical protein VNV66_16325 [Pilimelia sp.]|nr:hypothetical protein [Pilimelia sp.]